MPFSHDWFGRSEPTWKRMHTEQLGWAGKPGLRFLEIGCYQGRATCWMLENVLTDPSSKIEVIDTFEGGIEFPPHGVSCTGILDDFLFNTMAYRDKVVVHASLSFPKLCHFNLTGEKFDYIYVDGSHEARDVLGDAVLSWPLVKPQGVLCFDDITWEYNLGNGHWLKPGEGIRPFVSVFKDQLEVIMQECEQIAVRRIG